VDSAEPWLDFFFNAKGYGNEIFTDSNGKFKAHLFERFKSESESEFTAITVTVSRRPVCTFRSFKVGHVKRVRIRVGTAAPFLSFARSSEGQISENQAIMIIVIRINVVRVVIPLSFPVK